MVVSRVELVRLGGFTNLTSLGIPTVIYIQNFLYILKLSNNTLLSKVTTLIISVSLFFLPPTQIFNRIN